MDKGELDFCISSDDSDVNVPFSIPTLGAKEDFTSSASIDTDDLFGDSCSCESVEPDAPSASQEGEGNVEEDYSQDSKSDAVQRYGSRLCCYYLQGRCHFSARECWFSHDVDPSCRPWYVRPCQFGEDCLRGHWVALLAATLSVASTGISAKVCSQPLLMQRICGFLKPRILADSIAPAVKWRVPGVVELPVTPAAHDPFKAAVMEFLGNPLIVLSSLKMNDVCAHLSQQFGEITEEQRLEIVACVQQVFTVQDDARTTNSRTRSVADVKARIVEHVRDGLDCGYGLHLDGTIDALEDDVRDGDANVGPQDDATKSRWRQWIVDESIRQDCGVVV